MKIKNVYFTWAKVKSLYFVVPKKRCGCGGELCHAPQIRQQHFSCIFKLNRKKLKWFEFDCGGIVNCDCCIVKLLQCNQIKCIQFLNRRVGCFLCTCIIIKISVLSTFGYVFLFWFVYIQLSAKLIAHLDNLERKIYVFDSSHNLYKKVHQPKEELQLDWFICFEESLITESIKQTVVLLLVLAVTAFLTQNKICILCWIFN